MGHIETETWLDSLKVGDKVCYESRWGGYEIDEIVKITPKKQIKTKKNKTFRNGYYRVDSWGSYRLEPVTEEVTNHLRLSELRSKISNTGFSKCSIEKLEEIAKVLGIE
jgi:hypothetical protein